MWPRPESASSSSEDLEALSESEDSVSPCNSPSTSLDELWTDGGSSGASDSTARNRSLSRGRHMMARQGALAFKRAKHGGPMPQQLPDGTYVPAQYWGITRSQVERLFARWRRDLMWSDADSVSNVVKKFVKPETAGTRMGLALHLNQASPKRVNLMISHAWAENAKCFFEDVLKHTCEHEVAFICFLSNFQGTPEEIDAQLGQEIRKSPFTQVINSPACERLLVVPNEELRRSGQGLYSRLWCDWEIKVAADAGLPIFMTQRSTCEHLLGRIGGSSRKARCGDIRLPPNKDECLIRDAIERMPPATAKFHAIGVYTVSVCASYMPRIFFSIWGTFLAWILGLAVGLLLGIALMVLTSQAVRRSLAKIRHRGDGYAVLDGVIFSAAKGAYSFKRLRPDKDLPVLAVFCAVLALLDILVHMAFQRDLRCVPTVATEGGGTGLLFWMAWNVNGLGPWTGVFITRPWVRRVSSVLVFVGFVLGYFCGPYVVSNDGAGQGASIGCLSSLLVISLVGARDNGRSVRHAIGIFLTIGYLIVSSFYNPSPFAWRESFIIALGTSGVLLVPDWSFLLRVCFYVAGLAAMLGLLTFQDEPKEFAGCLGSRK